MPLTEKGKKILKQMQKEYGEEKGKSVFYASANSGKIKGVHLKRKEVNKMAKGKVRYGKRGGTYRLVKGKKVYVKHEKKHRKK